jgi:4'-phosphopantetheinyl transferase
MVAEGNAQPTRCGFAGDEAPGAPRVYVLPAPVAPAGAPPEAARRLARQHARAALRHLLAHDLGCAPEAIDLSDTRGQPVRAAGHERIGLSISHEHVLSLLALCPDGAVGVDVARVPAASDADELRRAAHLFLGPNVAAALDQQAHEATFLIAFAAAWAAHEARLKCIGRPLVEWSPALSARLAGVRSAAVELPPWAAADHVAAVAWRAAGLGG